MAITNRRDILQEIVFDDEVTHGSASVLVPKGNKLKPQTIEVSSVLPTNREGLFVLVQEVATRKGGILKIPRLVEARQDQVAPYIARDALLKIDAPAHPSLFSYIADIERVIQMSRGPKIEVSVTTESF